MTDTNESRNSSSNRRYPPFSDGMVAGIHQQVRDEIDEAFRQKRAFPFYPGRAILDALQSGTSTGVLDDEFVTLIETIFKNVADGDATVERRFHEDVRFSNRILRAIDFIHRIIVRSGVKTLENRRYVLIRRQGRMSLLYHGSEGASVTHIGLGPDWVESPSIYCGLGIFDYLGEQSEQQSDEGFERFEELISLEGNAIDEGISYSAELLQRKENLTSYFVKALEEKSVELPEEPAEPLRKQVDRPFDDQQKQRFYELLDTRLEDSPLDFDIDAVIRVEKQLERRARSYKRGFDKDSLLSVVELLVAASGHDIHEVRDRANLCLERVFAPKAYEAPLAGVFCNIRVNSEHTFAFSLPKTGGSYLLRLYKPGEAEELLLEHEIDFFDLELKLNDETGMYEATYTFTETGFCDFLIFRTTKRTFGWLDDAGCSGRINIIPDIRGEIVLQIFTDVHGHTRAYWQAGDGHPGLVYNEHGEVIRLGRFSDITAHLDNLKERYRISAIYLLGVFARGKNREDWAPAATSPSPFSPMSFREFESDLGGEPELDELIKAAHEKELKIIVDMLPHLNRTSQAIPDEWKVNCYDEMGRLVVRASTDGRYGSWDDGMLLNYREFQVWRWLGDSIEFLIDKGIDGIRFDTAHAVPIMMKKNNFPFVYERSRSHEEMVKGTIIVNDRDHDHLITTGYFDSACRDLIACPLQTYLTRRIRKALDKNDRGSFLYIAECYWGREKYLSRSGILPYNMALFKICESILHGKTDVREIYHLYHNYYPQALPPGTEMVGIFGNHDERRALNTFGKRGIRAAIGLTCFLSNMVLDYEGSAEGESWKVFPDNIYVDWNQFEHASDRSIETFYREIYSWHQANRGSGFLTWADNLRVAAALRFSGDTVWVGVFNFSDSNQSAEVHFDRPELPFADEAFYRLVDPLYSSVTQGFAYYTGRELRTSTIATVVSYTDRVKLLKLEVQEPTPQIRQSALLDSAMRLYALEEEEAFGASYAFQQCAAHATSYKNLKTFIIRDLLPLLNPGTDIHGQLALGLKRALYYMREQDFVSGEAAVSYIDQLKEEDDLRLSELGQVLAEHNRRGSCIFVSAEAEPFSKSGGLANVVFELPRELARLGEEVYVITPRYRQGSDSAVRMMETACGRYKTAYTGQNVSFFIEENEYQVGVQRCQVEGVTYFLLDHSDFFDGLYWGYRSEERLRKRVALARSSAEVILQFNLKPNFIFTNDAFAGVFNGIVRADRYYAQNQDMRHTSFFHIIHNGGWQYFDAYGRYENGKDLFSLFNLGADYFGEFSDPLHESTINCMAAGIRFADKSITVSPSYAHQLRIASDGLEQVVGDIIGISNAIGADFAFRAVDHLRKSGIVEDNYPGLIEAIDKNSALSDRARESWPEIIEGPWAPDRIKSRKRREIVERIRNKLLLQVAYGLDIDPDKKLAVMVHRIADQKGYQLLLEASEGIIKELGYQLIAGGPVAGCDQQSEELAQGLANLAGLYPGIVAVKLGFLDVRMPLLGGDVFLMPSRHEPGGISQVEALSCGSLVVARATGGLRDTIQPIQLNRGKISGNGILFTDYTPGSFYDAMERFAVFYDNADEDLRYEARQNARKSVWHWEVPAKQYLDFMYRHKEIIRK